MPGPRRAGLILYFSGGDWDSVVGTDRQLALALARRHDVLWVDPPFSAWQRRRRGRARIPIRTVVAPGLTRVHVQGPPGLTRPVLRQATQLRVRLAVARTLRRLGAQPDAVITTSPESLLKQWRDHEAIRIYYATDDFVAGAQLLGMSAARAADAREENLRAADLRLAVTTELAAKMSDNGRCVDVLPNGCDAESYRTLPAPAEDVALPAPVLGLIGQVNDRLDCALLEAVADAGMSLLIVGPRYEQDPSMTARLDALIERPNVQWAGRQPYERMPAYLAAIDVGLTPYAVTDFNQSSFPLKTLEYLAAGKPVVSTDLSAARALGTPDVRIACSASDFVEVAAQAGAARSTPEDIARRQAFAQTHSWTARADQLEALIERTRTNRERQ